MDAVLSGLMWETCLVYLDDIIVFGRTGEEHLLRRWEVQQHIWDANLMLKTSKCTVVHHSVEFLYMDVSLYAIGAIRAQVRDNREHIIACASHILHSAETNYAATKHLGIMWALQHFRPYIAGTKTTVIIDHQSLQ